jgi:hypothetical protein
METETVGKWKGLHADSNSPYKGLSHQEMVDVKRAKRMASIDDYDPAIRALIHDYGYTVVKSIYDLGVTKPHQIKHIVETVLNEFSPTRGAYSVQGKRTGIPHDRT